MMIRAAFLMTLVVVVQGVSRGEEGAKSTSFLAPPSATPNLSAISYKEVTRDRTFSRAWKVSLLPLFGSQALDAASSYGMRELNPLLADGRGAFGMKAAGIKFGAVGAFVGIQYLVIRKHPRAASAFAKLNWATGVVTTGFAAHNYAIR